MKNSPGQEKNSPAPFRLVGIISVVLGMFVAGVARADVYDITGVLQGTGPGAFGFSSFHVPNAGDPRTGTGLGSITSPSPSFSGEYDSVSGDLLAEGLLFDGVTFTLSGDLDFDANGVLASTSSLDITITSGTPIAPMGNKTIKLLGAYVCCGSTAGSSPNSFVVSGSSAQMSLWGADADGDPYWQDGKPVYTNSTLGMDLRFEMLYDRPSPDIAIPIPAAAWLFGSAILGLAAVARRKQA